MALVMRSTPFCTPSEQMRMETTHTTTIQKTHSTGEASIASKTAEVALRVGPHELPGGELRHVGEHPPGHRGVEHHEQVVTRERRPFEAVPFRARRLQLVEAARDALLARRPTANSITRMGSANTTKNSKYKSTNAAPPYCPTM